MPSAERTRYGVTLRAILLGAAAMAAYLLLALLDESAAVADGDAASAGRQPGLDAAYVLTSAGRHGDEAEHAGPARASRTGGLLGTVRDVLDGILPISERPDPDTDPANNDDATPERGEPTAPKPGAETTPGQGGQTTPERGGDAVPAPKPGGSSASAGGASTATGKNATAARGRTGTGADHAGTPPTARKSTRPANRPDAYPPGRPGATEVSADGRGVPSAPVGRLVWGANHLLAGPVAGLTGAVLGLADVPVRLVEGVIAGPVLSAVLPPLVDGVVGVVGQVPSWLAGLAPGGCAAPPAEPAAPGAPDPTGPPPAPTPSPPFASPPPGTAGLGPPVSAPPEPAARTRPPAPWPAYSAVKSSGVGLRTGVAAVPAADPTALRQPVDPSHRTTRWGFGGERLGAAASGGGPAPGIAGGSSSPRAERSVLTRLPADHVRAGRSPGVSVRPG